MFFIILWIIAFCVGYLIIYFSADVFLDNLKDLCNAYNINPFIIGLIILGIDPEEAIASIISAINGMPYIAFGNVIGNSIIALTLCFALPAFFYKIDFRSIKQFYFWVIYLCLGLILFGALISFGFLISGIIVLIIFVLYMVKSFKVFSKGEMSDLLADLNMGGEKNEENEAHKDQRRSSNAENQVESIKKSKKKQIVLIIVSFLLIVVGGMILIESTEQLILLTGLTESFFGFVIIAFVTNVEEITLVVKSIKKGSAEIGIGGMIGKIIWNLTITYGISGIIAVNIIFNWNIFWNWLLLLIVVLVINLLTKRKSIYWKAGSILLLLFIIFLVINVLQPI